MKARITVTIDPQLLEEIDLRVANGQEESRSAAMERALMAWRRQEQDRQLELALDALTAEDVAEMQQMAEEGLADYGRQLSLEENAAW